MENTATESVVEVQPQETTAQPTQDVSASEQVAPKNTTQDITIEPFDFPVETPTNSLDSLTPEKAAELFKGKEQDLLKAIGLDEFALGAIDYYKKTGSLAEYAEVKSVDWNKVPDEKVIESKLREQYSKYNLSEPEIQKLLQKEMRTRYLVDADPESESEEAATAKIQLKIDAQEYRNQRIERQAQFRAPEVKVEPTVDVQAQVQAQRQAFLSDPTIQEFVKSPKLTLGDPSSPFNYEVKNPQEALSILLDQNRYTYHIAQKNAQGQVLTKDGQPVLDRSKMLRIATYVRDMESYDKALIEHGKNLGRKKEVDEAENVVDNTTHGTERQADSLYDVLNRKLKGQ